MNFLNRLRQHLGWKLFLSHLVIVVVGVVVLAGTAELHAPTALSRHEGGKGAAKLRYSQGAAG
ncbi:MAG: hypothetical protein D6791_14590 [Chloroflexi bacterium]|nr:MAG: hypothetical protein D6791_14590 [Chloroflexota bacterium]